MKCKVRLSYTVELIVDGKNEDAIMDWLRQTTPKEAYKLANGHVCRADYDEEIMYQVRDDSIVDYEIKEDN